MPEARPERVEAGELHRNVVEIFRQLSEIDRKVTTIMATCGPCQERLAAVEETLDGNGRAGLKQRVAVVEAGRTDTLSIKSVQILLGAIGAFVIATLSAVAGLLWKSTPNINQ